VRRHPDILWQRREQDVASLVKQQANLLKQLWPLLKVGGKLLYCTCSVFKAEGSDQIDHFMKKNSNAVWLSSPGHIMPRRLNRSTDNKNTIKDAIEIENLKYPPLDQDGFFYALLEKKSD
jgi:16S rRNA (cytosine967-C5)-methyltransferase